MADSDSDGFTSYRRRKKRPTFGQIMARSGGSGGFKIRNEPINMNFKKSGINWADSDSDADYTAEPSGTAAAERKDSAEQASEQASDAEQTSDSGSEIDEDDNSLESIDKAITYTKAGKKLKIKSKTQKTEPPKKAGNNFNPQPPGATSSTETNKPDLNRQITPVHLRPQAAAAAAPATPQQPSQQQQQQQAFMTPPRHPVFAEYTPGGLLQTPQTPYPSQAALRASVVPPAYSTPQQPAAAQLVFNPTPLPPQPAQSIFPPELDSKLNPSQKDTLMKLLQQITYSESKAYRSKDQQTKLRHAALAKALILEKNTLLGRLNFPLSSNTPEQQQKDSEINAALTELQSKQKPGEEAEDPADVEMEQRLLQIALSDLPSPPSQLPTGFGAPLRKPPATPVFLPPNVAALPLQSRPSKLHESDQAEDYYQTYTQRRGPVRDRKSFEQFKSNVEIYMKGFNKSAQEWKPMLSRVKQQAKDAEASQKAAKPSAKPSAKPTAQPEESSESDSYFNSEADDEEVLGSESEQESEEEQQEDSKAKQQRFESISRGISRLPNFSTALKVTDRLARLDALNQLLLDKSDQGKKAIPFFNVYKSGNTSAAVTGKTDTYANFSRRMGKMYKQLSSHKKSKPSRK